MSFWAKIRASVVGFSDYPELIRSRFGRAFGYLALWLLIVVCVAGVIDVSRSLSVARDLQVAFTRAPDFGIRSGEIYFAEKMPYTLDLGGGATLIVDTNAAGDAALRQLPGDGILVTKNHIYQKQGTRVNDTDLSPLRTSGLSLSRADVVRFIGAWPWLVGFYEVLRYAWNLVAKLIAGLIFGLIGLAVAGGVIGFEGTLTAGLYALTLPALIDILVPRSFYASGFLLWLVYWGLGIAYTLLGVQAARRAKEQEPPAIPT